MYRLDWKSGDMSGTVENLPSKHKAMAHVQDLRWLLRLEHPFVYEVTEQPTEDEARAATLWAYNTHAGHDCEIDCHDADVKARVDKAGKDGYWVHARLWVWNTNNEGE